MGTVVGMGPTVAQGSTTSWYRWPFRIALLAVTFIWLGQLLYAGRLLLIGGPHRVVSWLYHIATPVTAEGQLVVPTMWDVILREGSLLALTFILWFASGFPMWRKRQKR